MSLLVLSLEVTVHLFRSLFAAINCLVISHSITTEQTFADVACLRKILQKMVKSIVIHGPHLLQLIAQSLFPYRLDIESEADIYNHRGAILEATRALKSVKSAIFKNLCVLQLNTVN